MKDRSFDYIWDEIILKSIEQVENSFLKQDKETYHFFVRDLTKIKRNVFSDYNSIKEHIKESYYNATNVEEDSDNRIDNHKIAACICYSLIRNKVFDFSVSRDMPKRMFTANYEVAYISSLCFIYAMLLARYKKIGRNDLADKLSKQQKLRVPETSRGHDEYHTGRINTLALNDLYGNTFDILTFSDMMFWIEYYNRQKIEQSLDVIPLDLPKEEGPVKSIK